MMWRMRQNKGSARVCTTEASCYADLLPPTSPAARVPKSASMSDTVIQPRPLGNPLAGQSMSGARMIMQVLADEGVTAIFGYSGGASPATSHARVLYNQHGAPPRRPPIPPILPAHAQGAGVMAGRLPPAPRRGGGWVGAPR